MNQCEDRIKELLPLYTDNELTSEEKAFVDKHVKTCSDCKEELQLFKEIHDELDLDSIKAPKGFHEDLVSKLELLANKSKPSLYKRYNKYLNVAAMLVFVILLGVLGLTQGNKWGQTSDESIMSDAKMVMEETTTEETSTEATSAEEATMESSEEKMAVAKESTMIMEDTTEESYGTMTIETEMTSDEGTNDEVNYKIADESSELDVSYSEETSASNSRSLLTEEESSQMIQTGNPKDETKTSVFVYILLTIVSLTLGGSVFYFVRKRILKN